MSPFLDTSVLLRYLTGDPPEMLEPAVRIIDETPMLAITDVVVAETAFVLTSVYEMPRAAVVDSLVDFLRKQNIAVYGLDKDLVIQGLLLCRPSARVSFADAMIWSAARSAAGTGSERATVYSFDRRFPSGGIDLRPA